MPVRRPAHPLEHHPSFRAVIAAAPPLAELATRMRVTDRSPRKGQPSTELDRAASGPSPADLVGALAIVCGDLADGFAAPPDSRRRVMAHQRAWIAVREIDRAVTSAARRRLAPPEVVQRAQRAIDRADVLIGALLPG